MTTLKGNRSEYYFEASRPLKTPGKFSVVYKGKNDDGQSFLIKRLSEYNAENIYQSKIIHPGFIKSIERIELNNYVYLVRPFIDGTSLNDLKNTNWFASEKKILLLKRIITEITEALASIHAQQLVHLDIRPHNIIVKESNNTDMSVVSIIDLDMVRPFNSNDGVKHFPLIYSAPELLLKRNKLIDNRTDIYAFSITLYKLIFNKRPFIHANAELILHLMLNKKLDYINNRTIPLVNVIN